MHGEGHRLCRFVEPDQFVLFALHLFSVLGDVSDVEHVIGPTRIAFAADCDIHVMADAAQRIEEIASLFVL